MSSSLALFVAGGLVTLTVVIILVRKGLRVFKHALSDADSQFTQDGPFHIK